MKIITTTLAMLAPTVAYAGPFDTNEFAHQMAVIGFASAACPQNERMSHEVRLYTDASLNANAVLFDQTRALTAELADIWLATSDDERELFCAGALFIQDHMHSEITAAYGY